MPIYLHAYCRDVLVCLRLAKYFHVSPIFDSRHIKLFLRFIYLYHHKLIRSNSSQLMLDSSNLWVCGLQKVEEKKNVNRWRPNSTVLKSMRAYDMPSLLSPLPFNIFISVYSCRVDIKVIFICFARKFYIPPTFAHTCKRNTNQASWIHIASMVIIKNSDEDNWLVYNFSNDFKAFICIRPI